MKRQRILRTLWSVSLAGLLWTIGTAVAYGQFTQNKKDTINIDASGFPADVHKGYQLFRGKCSECHGLDISLKPSMSSSQWSSEVKRMQAMASSQFNDKQAEAILRFLNYDETHRKAALKSAVAAPASDPVEAGRQFYFAQSCDACHSIAGKGGSLGSLDGVGSRLSREQLVHRMRVQPAGSAMPPLPAGTTDAQIDNLVDFLQTLKTQ